MSIPDTSDLNATQVRISITGGIWKAPTGTTVPTDADPFAALDAAFTNLGYISDDGVTENWDDSSDDIVAWQNAVTVRSSTTQSSISLEFMAIETKGFVLATFHRGSTIANVADGVWKLPIVPIVSDRAVWVFDAIDGTTYERAVIGAGEIVERGEVENMNGGAKGYPMTLRCYPDSNGVLINKYSNDPAWGYS